ncbi:MAG: bifunctional 5,10-methylenetetrahydrofolate dehydrogenase/5,10-methenyltetrahydrofolate cyclohydrolase [Chlamydiia bacterium]
MTLILDGKQASHTLRSSPSFLDGVNRSSPPHIALILIGNHPASLSYVSIKQRLCSESNITSSIIRFPEDVLENLVLEKIDHLNHDPSVDGILVQLPLPKHLNLQTITEAIDPKKDVDCFHPENVGRLSSGSIDGLLPCTPLGILELLRFYKLDAHQKEVCILGRSSIVGRPLSILLSLRSTIDATVTLCHQGTKHLFEHTKRADILIAAVGQPHLIKKEHIQDGAIIIDVGINRVHDKLVGDVDFEDVRDKARAITPVPGGVGPMTVYALLQNTIKAHKQRKANL